MADTLILEGTATPDATDLAVIAEGLGAHGRAAVGKDRAVFCVFARDGAGQVKGGLRAVIVDDVFLVKKLWVAEALRGSGLGRRLMAAGEDEARARGCARIAVDTMSFQAPDFYKSLGFQVKATVPDFYAGHDRIFFEKKLC